MASSITPIAIVLAIALAGTLPAYAAKASPALPIPVTVEQFEQVLSALGHPRDSKFAEQLAGYQLTQRAGSARLAHWLRLVPGKRSQQVLIALADLAAFEDLPVADFPPDAPPDPASQNAIFARVVNYVIRTQPRLPDFSALRSTTLYEVASPAQILTENRPIWPTAYASRGSNIVPWAALCRDRAGASGSFLPPRPRAASPTAMATKFPPKAKIPGTRSNPN